LVKDVGHLIIHGPEPEQDVERLISQLRQEATVDDVECDFTSLADVRSAAADIRKLAGSIDVLVNNAGVPGADTRRATGDGYERTFQVNYLALVLLTEELLPVMSNAGRVVNVRSTTHRMTLLALGDLNLTSGYEPVRAYAQSKLAILTYSIWLADRLPRQISESADYAPLREFRWAHAHTSAIVIDGVE
jgi:NAD(P)-dependent dehydrogenase (short-subunit alcohol dehydrogenase family)